MGCVYCKPSPIEDSRESPNPPPPARKLPSSAAVSSSEKKQGSRRIRSNCQSLELERRRERQLAYRRGLRPSAGIVNGAEAEQVAAGWPAWLAAVAGEAIRGWVPRSADSFEKQCKIGQGTYSNVYRARDLDNGKFVALKKVRFDNLDRESVRFMAREIHILRRLDHPNIVKLEGLVTSRMSCSLYLVFEYMEHDLAGLASFSGLKFSEPQVKCYMQQLLRGLDHCHSRGILHRDIKGSNLLIDNEGILKIADFGLASFFDLGQSHPLTSRVITLWYRPPELLLGATNYGVAVDLWSTGCILAELYAGKPIMPGRTEVEQLHKIFKLCGSPSEDYWRKFKSPHATIFKPQQPYRRRVAETFKEFPPSALALMDILLSVDPTDRGSAAAALKSEFFTTKPLAGDPSSFPRYPPSKELDAKIRDEEARRRGQRESRALPAPHANAELAVSLQKMQGQYDSKSRSEKFNPHQEEVSSGFRIEPLRQPTVLEAGDDPRGHCPHRTSHSGPLVNRNQWRKDEVSVSKVSARRNIISEDGSKMVIAASPSTGRLSDSGTRPSDVIRRQDQFYLSHGYCSHQDKEEREDNMDQSLHQGYGGSGNKIHYSGPLLRPSGNVEQMLMDHDRQIQEMSRRSRIDKSKARKVHGEGNQAGGLRPFDLGVVSLYPSSGGSVQLFNSSRGVVQ